MPPALLLLLLPSMVAAVVCSPAWGRWWWRRWSIVAARGGGSRAGRRVVWCKCRLLLCGCRRVGVGRSFDRSWIDSVWAPRASCAAAAAVARVGGGARTSKQAHDDRRTAAPPSRRGSASPKQRERLPWMGRVQRRDCGGGMRQAARVLWIAGMVCDLSPLEDPTTIVDARPTPDLPIIINTTGRTKPTADDDGRRRSLAGGQAEEDDSRMTARPIDPSTIDPARSRAASSIDRFHAAVDRGAFAPIEPGWVDRRAAVIPPSIRGLGSSKERDPRPRGGVIRPSMSTDYPHIHTQAGTPPRRDGPAGSNNGAGGRAADQPEPCLHEPVRAFWRGWRWLGIDRST